MYYGQHTQTGEKTIPFMGYWAVEESAEALGWEDCEWELMEFILTRKGNFRAVAEFPCTYYSHYGEDYFQCERTSNRPDSLCPFHAGEEG